MQGWFVSGSKHPRLITERKDSSIAKKKLQPKRTFRPRLRLVRVRGKRPAAAIMDLESTLRERVKARKKLNRWSRAISRRKHDHQTLEPHAIREAWIDGFS